MMAKSWPGNLDNCAITVRYDADGQGETYVLPDDQDELRAMPPVKGVPPKRKRRKTPGGMSSAERDVAGIEKRGKTGSEESEKCRRLCEHGREKSYSCLHLVSVLVPVPQPLYPVNCTLHPVPSTLYPWHPESIPEDF